MTQLSSFSIPRDLLDQVMRACFNCTVAVFWGEPDRQPYMNSASGVLLKLDRPLLLTAEHVLGSFLKRQAIQPSLKFQVAEGSIDDISERIIGRAHQPDLVTLDLTGIDIQQFSRHLTFHIPPNWPPPPVISGLSVLIVGFPMAYRSLLPDQRAIKFESWNLHTQVTSVSDHGFACAIETRTMANPSHRATWPQAYGGISGCPVFAIRGALSILELVGMVYEASDNLDIIKSHHSEMISTDGTFPNVI